MTTHRVLFVDDEVRVLDGLRRMLDTMRGELELSYATSGTQALELLDHQSFDIVVADMRMPGMTGVELLRAVMETHPHAVRIILSAQAEREGVFASVGAVHQYLAKPCDADLLRSTLRRACALTDLLSNPQLQQFVARMEQLPSLPLLYTAIMQELERPEASTTSVGRIVERDMAMSAKVLQLVNSAYFGLRQPITSPVQATSLLGMETIKTLVLSVHIFSQISTQLLAGLSLTNLWQHSLAVAACARAIVTNEGGDPRAVSTAYAAGLLHDVGKLILATNLTKAYASALALANANQLPACAVERSAFGATHAEVGGYLLGIWGLPQALVEATAFHHDRAALGCESFSTAMAVYVANYLVHEGPIVEAADGSPLPASGLQLPLPDFNARLANWRNACRVTLRGIEAVEPPQ